jgi:hypothetical protein
MFLKCSILYPWGETTLRQTDRQHTTHCTVYNLQSVHSTRVDKMGTHQTNSMFYGGSLVSTSGSLHILLSTHGQVLRQVVAAAAVVVTAASVVAVVDHMAAVIAIVRLLIVDIHRRRWMLLLAAVMERRGDTLLLIVMMMMLGRR